MKALDVGDTVEIGVTHQVKIGREDSWVKTNVTGHVRPGELPAETIDRLSDVVNGNIIRIIEQTVKTVNDAVK